MIETRGGFLISQIKQIQGRIFGKLLTNLTALKGIFSTFCGRRIICPLWNLPEKQGLQRQH